jgi:hypothetical protein
MWRLSVALACAAFLAFANPSASNAETTNPPAHCHAHKAQADCAADQACTWDAAKSQCHRNHPSN